MHTHPANFRERLAKAQTEPLKLDLSAWTKKDLRETLEIISSDFQALANQKWTLEDQLKKATSQLQEAREGQDLQRAEANAQRERAGRYRDAGILLAMGNSGHAGTADLLELIAACAQGTDMLEEFRTCSDELLDILDAGIRQASTPILKTTLEEVLGRLFPEPAKS